MAVLHKRRGLNLLERGPITGVTYSPNGVGGIPGGPVVGISLGLHTLYLRVEEWDGLKNRVDTFLKTIDGEK